MKTLIENENFNIFEAGYFATRIRVDRILNHSGVRFQQYAVSVSGFTRAIYTRKNKTHLT